MHVLHKLPTIHTKQMMMTRTILKKMRYLQRMLDPSKFSSYEDEPRITSSLILIK